jgi:CheY-like chemotaxis protein
VRVLVVDDDDAIRDVLRLLLEDEGYHVSVAPDGERGLLAILDCAEPLVVLLDLLLPGLSGEETLAAALEYQRADARRLRVKFILITAMEGQTNTPAMIELTKQNDIPVIPKPFELDRLLSTIARAAARLARSA